MTDIHDGDRVARRARVEAALADYPDLDADRIAEVRHWFRKEASALDVALLASNQEIAEAYRRFCTEHVDPMSRQDILRAVGFAAAVAAIIALIAWLAL